MAYIDSPVTSEQIDDIVQARIPDPKKEGKCLCTIVHKYHSKSAYTFSKKGIKFNYSWAAPYNPEISLRLGYHINVELIATCQLIS